MKFEYFVSLPNEIIDKIWDLLDDLTLLLTNKSNYIKYHSIIYQYISTNVRYSYYRNVIRNDDCFVLNCMLSELGKTWCYKNKYVYKKNIYSSYYDFLLDYAIRCNSNKCRKEIMEYGEKTGLGLNLHKKNRIRSIIWTN